MHHTMLALLVLEGKMNNMRYKQHENKPMNGESKVDSSPAALTLEYCKYPLVYRLFGSHFV